MKPLLGRFVLVVDSCAPEVVQWRERLLGQGGRVICSASIDSAIANALTFPGGTFDAALIEHRPPVLDAVDVVEVMRALPGTRGLPVLVVAPVEDCADIERRVERPGVVLPRPISAETAALGLARLFAAVRTPGSPDTRVVAETARGRILVAEDDPVNAETLRAMLVKLGYVAELARNGEEAVARAASGEFDAILMDGQMPALSGTEATRLIRCDEARRGVRRPIIGVTAYTSDAYCRQCFDAGMDAVVSKPVGMAGLVRVLSRWLPAASGRPATGSQAAASNSTPAVAIPRDIGPDAEVVIDWEQIEALRAIDPRGESGIVGRAIGLYIDNAPKLIGEIRSFRDGKDLADVRRAAHSLKSSSASLGATIVAGLSKTIELAAAQGDVESIGATVVSLEAEYRRAASELRKSVA